MTGSGYKNVPDPGHLGAECKTVTISAGGLRDLGVAADPLPDGSYALEIKVEDVCGYTSDVIEYDLTVDRWDSQSVPCKSPWERGLGG